MTTAKIDIPIKVDHVARIEGKAGIDVIIDKNKLKEIKVRIFEGPRFFEAITLGKPIAEATAIFPRVCSFCAAAHKITALYAAEEALALKVSKQTKQLRELMYLGDQIESHTLHLFLLALPDFLGFPDAFSMSKKHGEAVKIALELKDIGAEIQTLLGSRFMHQENAIIGGFGKLPSKTNLERIKNKLHNSMKDSELALELFTQFDLWPEVSSERMHLALRPYDKEYGVLGESIVASDSFEFPDKDYRKHIKEKIVSHSFAKHSLYKDKPFMTSALSRYVHFKDLLSGRAKELSKQYDAKIDASNPMSNNLAQAIELVYFIEKAKKLTENLISDLKEEQPKKVKKKIEEKIGVSVSEAPRGLLTYTLGVDKEGKVKSADIITPTAMFLPQLELDLKNEINHLLGQKKPNAAEITQKLETIVRAYDPCVSCSVHVTGVKK